MGEWRETKAGEKIFKRRLAEITNRMRKEKELEESKNDFEWKGGKIR